MKKSLLTTLFIAFAITLGFGSTPITDKQDNTTTSVYSEEYRNYYVGELYGEYPTFEVYFEGEYVGTAVPFINRVSGYTFMLYRELLPPPLDGEEGERVPIGQIVTRQNGQLVFYNITAILR